MELSVPQFGSSPSTSVRVELNQGSKIGQTFTLGWADEFSDCRGEKWSDPDKKETVFTALVTTSCSIVVKKKTALILITGQRW